MPIDLEEPTVVLIPNVFDGDRQTVALTIGETIAESLPHVVTPDGSWVVVENGRVLPPEEWQSRLVTPNTDLTAYPRVENSPGLRIGIGVALIVIAAVSFQYELVPASVALMAGSMGAGLAIGGVQQLMMAAPHNAVTPVLTSDGGGSATYGFGGITNSTRIGAPIPIIYGLHRAGGQIINLFVRSQNDNDVLYLLIGLSEGTVIDISDVQVNGQPVTNYTDVTLDTRFGNNTQSAMALFGDNTSTTIAADAQITTSYLTYTTLATNVTAIELNVSFPGGLYSLDPASGNFVARSVTLMVQYKLTSSGTWIDAAENIPATVLVAGTPSLVQTSSGGGFLAFGLPSPRIYYYAVSLLTTHGETLVGTTASISVAAGSAWWVTVSVPTNADPTVVGMRVYRWDSGNPSNIRLIGTVNNSGLNAMIDQFYDQGSPAALPTVDATTGRLNPSSAGIVLTDARRVTIRKTVRLDNLTAGQYDVRVLRTNTQTAASNAQDEVRRSSVTEIVKDNFTYPNLALLGIRALATNQLSGGLPTITALVRGRSIRVFSDVTTYAWQWSQNPSWVVFDLLTNTRYGAGNSTFKMIYNTGTLALTNGSAIVTLSGGTTASILPGQKVVIDSVGRVLTVNAITDSTHFTLTAVYSGSTASGLAYEVHRDDLDIQSFVDWADFCNQGVENPDGIFEPRALCDVVLDQERQSAWDAIMKICSIAQAVPVKMGNYIKIKIEQATTPVQLFSMANIVAGSFKENFFPLSDRFNSFEVQYLNAANDYRQDLVVMEDPLIYANGEIPRPNTINLYGITRATHAARVVRMAYLVNRYITRSIVFQVGIDALACEPGDVIRFQHDVPQWGYGGRAASGSTSSTIVLDHSVTMVLGRTYEIVVRHADDTVETKVVPTVAGTFSTLTITGTWTSTPAKADLWAFGETAISTKPFRITEIQRTSELTVQIAALEYDENIYDDTVTDDVRPVQYSVLSDLAGPTDPVTNLEIVEEAGATDSITIGWTTPGAPTFRMARVYRIDNGVDEHLGDSTTGSLVFPYALLTGTVLQIRVTSVSTSGVESNPAIAPTATYTVGGVRPPDVEIITFFFNGTVPTVAWNAVSWLNQITYEVRKGPTDWESSISLGFTVNTNFQTAGDGTYWVKAVDSLGNYSENAASVEAINSDRTEENVFVTIDEGAAGFLGTVSGAALVTGGQVVLTGTGLVDAIPDVDAVVNWDSYGGISGSGTYTIPTGSIVDIGVAKPCRVTYEIALTGTSIGNAGDDIVVTVEIQLAQDDGILGNWTAFIPGTYVGRKFNFRVTMEALSTDVTEITLTDLVFIVDMPDLIEKVYNYNLVTGGAGIGLTTAFQTTPTVHVQIINAVAGDTVILSGQTPSFFAVEVRNGGVLVPRNINYTAIGY